MQELFVKMKFLNDISSNICHKLIHLKCKTKSQRVNVTYKSKKDGLIKSSIQCSRRRA